MNYEIDIDGAIGAYGYSKQYVRAALEKHKNKPVNVRINSLGGSLDDALDMAARFNEHGQVTVYMFGYCASAATVASLGAAKVVIDENAFYLAHKVMNWVDIWGLLNADEMQATIEELEANKRDNEKMDLVLARMYAKKSGKKANEIMDVLKEGAWLTAEDALNLGFVDEIGHGLTYDKQPIEAKLNALGLPLPAPRHESKSFVTSFKNMFNKKFAMLKNYLNLNALLNVEGFEEKENSVLLTVDQITTIDNRMKADAEKIDALTKSAAEKDNTIAELQKQIVDLQNQPGDDTKPVQVAEDNVTAQSMFNQVKDLI